MKKEYILSDEEKQQKKQKIAENRVKKHQKLLHRTSRIDTDEQDSESPSRPEPELGSHDGSNSPQARVDPEPVGQILAGPAPKIPRINNNPSTFQQLLEEPHPQNYEQNFQPFMPENPTSAPQEGFLQDADLNFDNLDEIVAIAIKAEFGTFDLADFSEQPMQQSASSQSTSGIKEESNQQQHQSLHQEQPSAISDRPLLNDRERARLDELFVASRALVEPMEHERDVSNCRETKYLRTKF